MTDEYLIERQGITFKYDQTLELSHRGMDKKNVLDTTHMKEENFRMQLFTNRLPVLNHVIKWNNNNRQYTHDNFCPRCNREIETQSHIFTCITNNNYSLKIVPKNSPTHVEE